MRNPFKYFKTLPEIIRLAVMMYVIGNPRRQETGRWLNNRAENSHLPFRRKERAMGKFLSFETFQKFVSTHSSALSD